MIYSLFNDIFDPYPVFPRQKHSVYVISDSELARWKRKQAEQELVQLDELIEGHKRSIECLEKTKQQIQADLPELPEADKPATTAE